MAQALRQRIGPPPQGGLGESLENAKSLAAALVAVALMACSSNSSSPSAASGTWTTYRGDAARDGHPSVATLDAAAARRLTLAWRAHLSGAVDGTPAVASGLVVAGSMGGELAAFDVATGREKWKVGGLGQISASPAVEGGHVLVATLDGHVRAFDLETGRRIWDWKAPGDHPAIWSSPAVTGRVVVIGSGSPYGDTPFEPGRLSGLDVASGRELWTTCMRPACASGGGIWSTASFDPADTGYVGVGNPYDGVRAFDPVTGRVLWEVSLYADNGQDLDVGASPVVLTLGGQEALAVASVSGLLTLLDARNGAILWKRQVVQGSEVHGLLATPAYDGSRLYAVSAGAPDGVFALNTDGSSVWKESTDLPVYSAPVVAHGVLVFGRGNVFGDVAQGSLTMLSTAGGQRLWSFDTHSAVRSSPAVIGDSVIAGDVAGDVLVFTPAG